MFRFGYLVPRLLILLGVCVFLRWGLDSSVAFVLKQAGQAVVGARVDIDAADATLFRGQMHLSKVQVADPASPDHNLFSFDGGWMKLDERALQNKRFIVTQGLITGLQFNTLREYSGRLDDTPPREPSEPGYLNELQEQWMTDASAGADAWLDDLQNRLEGDLRNEFKSIPLAEELSRRWSAEYERRGEDVQRWKSRIDEYEKLIRSVRQAPLQHLTELPRYVQELQDLQADLSQLKAELNQLGQQVVADKTAVEEAKTHDLRKIEEFTQLDQLDPKQLTQYLLGEQLRERIAYVQQWIQRGRRTYEILARPPKINSDTGRGVDFPFGTDDRPRFLIERLAASGQWTQRQAPVEFLATAVDITHQPKRHARPAVIELQTKGEVAAQARIEIDQRGLVPKYRYTVQCPQLRQPETRLGKTGNFGLIVNQGRAAVWCDLHVTGNQLAGEIRWRQDDVRSSAQLEGKYAELVLPGLQKGLDSFDKLHAIVQLSGSVQRPTWKLQSNLGPQVAAGLSAAANDQVDQFKAEASRRLDEEVARYVSQLDQQLASKQADLDEVFATIDVVQRQLQDQVKRQIPVKTSAVGNAAVEAIQSLFPRR